MNKKVSVREVIATKIVIALLLAGNYWMWSREDWRPEYRHFQGTLGMLLLAVLFFHYMRVKKYKRENMDELAEKNLMRCDAICLKIFTVVMLLTAYISGILGHVNVISTTAVGWIIMIAIIAISIFRTVLFIIMDTKGV
ncbi:hypothetical protein HMPREF0379_1530 [[Eubacterium] yurii subsp. margaretiae ATCC 43715]|nr:hypothetical protein HMPREF0379_1530 [[Eubacterium] yurii subsp. margaretiae ATCC 43715]